MSVRFRYVARHKLQDTQLAGVILQAPVRLQEKGGRGLSSGGGGGNSGGHDGRVWLYVYVCVVLAKKTGGASV